MQQMQNRILESRTHIGMMNPAALSFYKQQNNKGTKVF
jgi:hypothetical protein